MKLDNNFHIEKDDHSYNLFFVSDPYIAKSGKKKGQETTAKKIWYYPNLSTALMGYLSHRLDTNDKTAENVLKQITEVKETIQTALKNQRL